VRILPGSKHLIDLTMPLPGPVLMIRREAMGGKRWKRYAQSTSRLRASLSAAPSLNFDFGLATQRRSLEADLT
jgi:hypothetical protein